MLIDCHMHVRGRPDGSLDEEYCDRTIEAGDLLGIDVFCISDIDLTGGARYERFHQANDRVKQAVERYPGRYLGYCFVNPGDPRALDEVRQRVRDEGFIGVKLYHQYRIDEPVQEPLLELATAWQIPVLMHAGHPTDPDTMARQPRISDAAHFVRAARRFPEAILIEGHIGGGGDWEWALKHLREAPSVYLDTSGSVVDEWLVDRCVESIGVERLLFATDMTMEGGVGKVLDADLTEAQRRKILGESFQAILDRRAVS
ncbi:MAG TPA: amidohydrolase family protein [Candidatus Hydrogenedentes bacterium]|nr:amidohydrolase family protein [Candidatus Hydrogenedentota bacterium]HPG66064.1 amidohydrolase family protein [Candidatus Hydrogenedentota bacterium]